MVAEQPVFKSIAVVGTRTASRTVAMATLLHDCIARHGWAERLTVFVAGWGAGAGDADDTDIGMLARDGFEPIALQCTDVAADQAVLEDADCFVVASEEDACMFLEWPQAEGKHILALTDYLDDQAWAIRAVDSGFRDFMDEVTDAVPSVVRELVALPGV
jgi:hypothetical protein